MPPASVADDVVLHELTLCRGKRREPRGHEWLRVQHDLAGEPRVEKLEGGGELLEHALVRDERSQIDDAGLEQPTRLVPGGENAPAAEREHVEVLEDERF